jgi:hypothetical protein
VIVSANERILQQLEATGTVAVIGPSNVYIGDQRVGAALNRASEDALGGSLNSRAADPPSGGAPR